MSTRITKGGLVGLLAGVGLATIFPPLGAALVIAGTVGGVAVGHAMDEEEREEKEGQPEKSRQEKLWEEFNHWDHKLVSSANEGRKDAFLQVDPALGPSLQAQPGPSTNRASVSQPDTAPFAPPMSAPGFTPHPRQAASPTLYEQVARAEELLKNGRFMEAIDQFRQLKESLLAISNKVSPSDRQRVIEGLRLALHRLAGVLIENDSPAEAEDLLKEALDLSPDNQETLLHLARLQMMLNHPGRAEPYLLSAIKAHPSDPDAYRLLGDIYVESGRLESARDLFRSAIEQDSDSALTIEMLERISGLDLKDPNPLMELGRAQAAEGAWEEAARAYRQALSLSPGNVAIQRRLGSVCLRLDKQEEGRRLLESVDGLQNDIEALSELSHFYVRVGEYNHAQLLLQRLIELDQSLAAMDPADRRARLRELQLVGDQVETLYAPIHIRLLVDFALTETRCGSITAAAEAARQAIAYGGTSLSAEMLEIVPLIAAEFQKQGQLAEARIWTEEVARIGGSLSKVQQEKDTYEDFLRRFKYQPQDLIAEGGMARVYRGVDTRTNRTVAIKRMHDRFCTDPQAIAYFYREVRALEELSRPYPHPNVVEFIANGVTESRFIFAMEYVDGPGLRQVMERGDEWSLTSLCLLMEGICSGLDRAHNSVRSIIHRDLKPENILLASGNTPKLTDFGICRVSSLFSASRRYYGSTRSFVGTSLYSAPEQYPDPYSGQLQPPDPRSDLYSLGCILYEILTTQPPFVSDDPGLIGLMHQRRPLPGQSEAQPLLAPSSRNPLALHRFDPSAQSKLDAITMKCLEIKPSHRYRTARDIKAEFENLRNIVR